MGFLWTYLAVTGIIMAGAGINFFATNGLRTYVHEHRKSAQIIFLAPLWPIMIFVLGYQGLKYMWEATGWELPRRR